MSAPNEFLDRIRVAEPCSASWEAMTGDDRKRFCGDCKLHVYNFSAMTKREAESVIQSAEGRVCGRFFRREDGTVLTQDCGPVRRAIQRRLRVLRVAASALFGFLATFALSGCGRSSEEGPSKVENPPAKTDPVPPKPKVVPHPEDPRATMGEICVPEERLGRIALPQKPPPPKPQDGGSAKGQ